MALDAKVLVSAADRAVSQSADATGVAQDAASRLDSMREGEGTVEVGQNVFKGSYSFPSRFEEGTGTTVADSTGHGHLLTLSGADGDP